MGKRRFAQVSSGDDDGEEAGPGEMKSAGDGGDPAPAVGGVEESGGDEQCGWEEETGMVPLDVKPVGDVIRVSGRGRNKKEHYAAFEYDGSRYELEDSVLVTPEDPELERPSIAIIKAITRDSEGDLMVMGQWFFRPEDAVKKNGSNFQVQDSRELFYSFRLDEVPAACVMHRCVVHFIPPNKQLPARTEHPGFIVRKVYDVTEKKVWKITDKDYEDDKQQEINLLIEKTRQRLGELPDGYDTLSPKSNLREEGMLPVDVSRDDNATRESSLPSKTKNVSEAYSIIKEYQASTGNSTRDQWLERLIQATQVSCHLKDGSSVVDREKTSGPISNVNNAAGMDNESEKTSSSANEPVAWTEDVVPTLAALEKSAHEAFSSDFQKYNQKMRQLNFNLKNNSLLAKRLLKKELEPSVVVNMSPNELKDGFTSNEKRTQEPEQSRHMQMTDARCDRCTAQKVGVVEIIHAGRRDRYQFPSEKYLETLACHIGLQSHANCTVQELPLELITQTWRSNLLPSTSGLCRRRILTVVGKFGNVGAGFASNRLGPRTQYE